MNFEKKIEFVVTKEHLKLVRRMYVGWQDDEFGAPEIDPKRPYGNSDVLQDIVEILGPVKVRDGLFKLDLFGKEYFCIGEDKYNLDIEKELEAILNKLHRETETVL